MDLLQFLSSVSLFQKLTEPVLKELINILEVIQIQGGDVLIEQGEEGNCLYILMQGRLQVHQRNSFLEDIFLGEIGVGEVIGEIALLSEEKRMATVRAIRDSSLLKLSQEDFRSFVLKYPDLLLDVTKECLARLLHKNHRVEVGALRTIALATAGNARIPDDFVTKFVKALSLLGKVLHLTSSSKIPSSDWLIQQEENYDYVIYETDLTMTPWTQICLRQADRVVFVGAESEMASLNPVEDFFFKGKRVAESELVILCEKTSTSFKYSHLGFSLRENKRCHHIRNFSDKDFNRFIRFMCGKSIGLVLSGGGARGLAHIGLIRAMEELNIPIDYIAGTSMGAAVAAAVAVGMDYQTIIQNIKKHVVPAARGWDYTLPFLSLKSGKKITKACQNIFGEDLYIEDCPINFFCVSTNLSYHRIEVHQKGLLWEAVRASLALPAILPPIVDGKGNLLVDGGIINNLPVDIMKRYINGGKIIASSLTPIIHPKYDSLSPIASGWSLTAHNFGNHRHKIPNMGNVIISSLMLGSNHHQICMEEEADYCVKFSFTGVDLMDFNLFNEIIDQGYEMALKQLKEIFPDAKNP
ncbi:MAG: patatin-like phospholipase family protein [Verrucomicrobia bacterium]|nr:patatin-like phospholipase family protein [Verrucomicrobiota bacterium]